jgi:membrane-associated phospholipid phosphatase
VTRTHSTARGVTFHKGWSEKYGFHVAESLAVLSASLFAFAWIAESYVANASLNRWDARFNQWLNHEAWPPLVRLFETVTIPGGVLFLVAVTAAAATLLAARRNFADATLLVAAFSGASLLNLLVKLTFERPRPAFRDADLTFDTFSFPSAHASVSVAVYGALTVIVFRDLRGARVRAGVLLALVGLLASIGFSRIYLGAHYFSDVLAGISLGTAWLMTCVLAINACEAWLHGRARTGGRRVSPPPALVRREWE